MTEFYDVVDIIRDSLRNSNNINTVTFGDLSEVDLDGSGNIDMDNFM